MGKPVGASIIGELLLGELDEWYVGVCTLRRGEKDGEDVINVRGDNGHLIASVETDEYTESQLDGKRVKDLPAIATKVSYAILSEHDEL